MGMVVHACFTRRAPFSVKSETLGVEKVCSIESARQNRLASEMNNYIPVTNECLQIIYRANNELALAMAQYYFAVFFKK